MEKTFYPSIQTEEFINGFEHYIPEDTIDYDKTLFDGENYEEKIKLFRIQVKTILKPEIQYELETDDFLKFFFTSCSQHIQLMLDKKNFVSDETFYSIVSNFIYVCIVNMNNADFIRNVILKFSTEILTRPKLRICTLLKKILLLCKFIEGGLSDFDAKCLVYIPDEHFDYLYEYLGSAGNIISPIYYYLTFPNCMNMFEHGLTPKNIVLLPDPYTLLEHLSAHDFICPGTVCSVMIYCRSVFNRIEKDGLTVENLTLISNLLSAGELFRGCFSLFIILVSSIPCFIPSFLRFANRLTGKHGAVVLRQLITMNTTKTFLVLLRCAGQHFAQLSYIMKDFIDSDIINSISSYSLWNSNIINNLSEEIPQKLQTTKLFTKYLVFSKINQMKKWEIFTNIEDICGNVLKLVNILVAIIKDRSSASNLLSVKIICPLLDQIFKFIMKFIPSYHLAIIGEPAVSLAYYTLDFLFSVKTGKNQTAIMCELVDLFRTVSSFIIYNVSMFKMILTIAPFNSRIFPLSYIISKVYIKPKNYWENVFYLCIISENSVGYFCASQLLSVADDNKIDSVLRVILNLSVSATADNRDSIIKSISKVLLLLGTVLSSTDYILLSKSKYAKAILTAMNEFFSTGNPANSKSIVFFVNAAVVFYSKINVNLPQFSYLVPVVNLLKYAFFMKNVVIGNFIDMLINLLKYPQRNIIIKIINFSFFEEKKIPKRWELYKSFIEAFPTLKFPDYVEDYVRIHDEEIDYNATVEEPLVPWEYPTLYNEIFGNNPLIKQIDPL